MKTSPTGESRGGETHFAGVWGDPQKDTVRGAGGQITLSFIISLTNAQSA